MTAGEEPSARPAVLPLRSRISINLNNRQKAEHVLTALLLGWVAIDSHLELAAGTNDVVTEAMIILRTLLIALFFVEEEGLM